MTGREAYEEDCRRLPTYEDGTPRKAWEQLAPICRLSWERNPEARPWVLRGRDLSQGYAP